MLRIYSKQLAVKWDEGIYNIPAYLATDAARHLRIPVVTLRFG